jgi:hypothetical protein
LCGSELRVLEQDVEGLLCQDGVDDLNVLGSCELSKSICVVGRDPGSRNFLCELCRKLLSLASNSLVESVHCVNHLLQKHGGISIRRISEASVWGCNASSLRDGEGVLVFLPFGQGTRVGFNLDFGSD